MAIKRIFLILLCICLLPVVPAQATQEEQPVINYAYINISSCFDDKTRWDAIVVDESLILLKVEDIATMLGIDLNKSTDTWTYSRGTYRLQIDVAKKEAVIYLETDYGRVDLYGGAFDLSEMVPGHPLGDFLPMEKMLYLLQTRWLYADDFVYLEPTQENLWDVMADSLSMTGVLPKYTDVVGSTWYEIWGNAAKYSLLSVVDELDWRVFDFSGNSYETSKIQDSLFEMMNPSSCRIGEADFAQVIKEMDSAAVEGIGDFLKSILNTADVLDSADVNMVELAAELLGDKNGYLTSMEQLGSFTEVSLNALSSAVVVLQNISKSMNWPEQFSNKLDIIKEMKGDGDTVNNLKLSAATVQTLYSDASVAYAWGSVQALWDVAKDLMTSMAADAAASIGLAAVPALVAGAKIFTVGINAAKLVCPPLKDALEAGDKRWLARVEYNLAWGMIPEVGEMVDSISGKEITKEDLQKVRNTLSIMTEAGAHCYLNLAETAKEEKKSTLMQGAYKNIGNSMRIENSVYTDDQILLCTDYSNLHTYETLYTLGWDYKYGRPEIPMEYAHIYYPIYTFEDFSHIGEHTYGEYWLMDDIVCPDSYTSLGRWANGILRGYDHTISNISSPLFSMAIGCHIENLNLQVTGGSAVETAFREGGAYGALVREFLSGTISGCTVSGTINAVLAKNVGGSAGSLVGSMDGGHIENCTSKTNIDISCYLRSSIGGIVGYCKNSTFVDCTNEGSVRVTTEAGDSSGGILYLNAGGIAGDCVGGSIKRSINNADIYTSGGLLAKVSSGGIIGRGSPYMELCGNSGDITALMGLGGQNGWLADGTGNTEFGTKADADKLRGGIDNVVIMSWYWPPDGGQAGGLAGRHAGSLSQCINTGNINGSYIAGGLVAKSDGAKWQRCCNKGDVQGQFCTGGLVGYLRGAVDLTSCVTAGSVGSAFINGDLSGVMENCKDLNSFGNFYLSTIGKIVDICDQESQNKPFATLDNTDDAYISQLLGEIHPAWEVDPQTGALSLRKDDSNTTP